MLHIDSFSGTASDLRGSNRTAENVLTALRKSPRLSCWDMEENAWLRNIIKHLELAGKIQDDRIEPYPWIRYKILAP